MTNWDQYIGVVQTSSRPVDVRRMTPADVDIHVIAHSLARINRYLGHARRAYSVAEHSILTCYLAERDHPIGSPIARAALLHDAHEAYIGDMAWPLKQILPDFRALERQVEQVVRDAMLLPRDPNIWMAVRAYDVFALMIEARELLPKAPWLESVPERFQNYRPPNMRPEDAEARFLTLVEEHWQ